MAESRNDAAARSTIDVGARVSDSEMGMRVSGIPSHIANRETDFTKKSQDPTLFLATLLEKNLGIYAKPLALSDYFTLENLVMEIHEFPPYISNLDYFRNADIVPLISYKIDDKISNVVLGIRCNHIASAEIHDCTTLKDKLEELFPTGILGADKEKTTYLILKDNEFDQVLKLVKDSDARKSFLNLIDDDQSARDIYLSLLNQAIMGGATDIHLEPMHGYNKVRYRLDGFLSVKNTKIRAETMRKLVSLIKIESKMQVEESRRPQDGVIVFDEDFAREHPILEGYSLRVSTMPTNHGEKVVMRILQSKEKNFDLGELGFPQYIYSRIIAETSAPYGLFLVTGPTGSGKTTTLYSILQHINQEHVNIVTIEDPIEIDLDGINQSQVNRAIGWDFSNVLRTYLRQDPDVILVGEIRDSETAKMTIEAAKTGHLVFSTLHTNDSILSLLRLYELGVDNSDIQSSLKAVISQRLVRTLCEPCREEYDASEEINSLLGDKVISHPLILYREGGKKNGVICPHCDSIGFSGRTVVPEMWILSESEKQMIYEGNKSHRAYLESAVRNGMKPLVQTGVEKVLAGQTTFSELIRAAVPLSEFISRREILSAVIKNYARSMEAAKTL